MAAIFRMAWFAAPLPARLVDEWPLSETVLAHILWVQAFIHLTQLGLGVIVRSLLPLTPHINVSHKFALSRG